MIVVLAHAGGWDEALYAAVPMAVLVGLLWLAQKRAADQQDADEQDADQQVSGQHEPDGVVTEPDGDGR